MSRIIFIFLLLVVGLIRGPLSLILVVFKNIITPLNKRILFERKNFFNDECRSFKFDLKIADFCFEISSEGELEQVRPLIEYYLGKEKKIEILFASPSVETKCLKLAQDFKDQIRVFRLPIVSFAPVPFFYFQSPWSWVSAPVIIFCRYDFYPELLSFKFFGKKLILVSATNKNPSWFKNQSYFLFDFIVAANDFEARYFRTHFEKKKIESFDFRIPRIFRRLESAAQTLNSVIEISSYLKYLNSDSDTLKMVMGSAWESDLDILKTGNWAEDIITGKIHLLIVPHDLSTFSIAKIKDKLDSFMSKVPIYEIKRGEEFECSQFLINPGIIILNLTGILCEIYSKFSWAYVGGGYERSIHSVLEPFLSGSIVVVGPKIYRSTEYDLVKEYAPDEIHLLKDKESFYTLIKENALKTPMVNIRTTLKNEGVNYMKNIMSEFEIC